jgi:hypothetical protein
VIQKEFCFAELKKADLHVDALYKAGTQGNMSDDPISKLGGCENQGGFFYQAKLIVLRDLWREKKGLPTTEEEEVVLRELR